MTVKNEIAKHSHDDSDKSLQYEEWPMTPAADIFDEGEVLVFSLNMPGVSEKTLDVEVEKNELRISAKQDFKFPEKMELIYQEWTPASYSRSFSLPSDVDTSNISAKISNGVLTVTVPKSEEAKPKKIKVISQ